MHCQQVAIQDAALDHAVTSNLQQVVGTGAEERGGQFAVVLDVFLRKDRITRGHPADDGQTMFLGQLDAARGPRNHFDGTLPGQRLQVLLGRIGAFEAKLPGDIGTGGWIAGFFEVALDEVEHLRLSRG